MKVLVIGAGAVGLTAALIAERAGHQVTLIDPKGFNCLVPQGEINTRVWALGQKARYLLSNLGILFDSDRICHYTKMRVLDAGSDAKIVFESDQLGDIVESDWLRAQLIAKVEKSSIACRVDPILSVSSNGVIKDPLAQLDICDLAIFCEGRFGKTAQASGFETRDLRYNQYAVVGTLACDLPHHGEAFQIFTDEGPLALLPLPPAGKINRVSLVWSVSRENYCRLSTLTDLELSKKIEIRSELVRGRLLNRSAYTWIPISQHYLKNDQLGVCLAIGDTAHSVLPLAGLGANLGFADVEILANSVNNRKHDGYQVARTVARQRRIDNLAVMGSMAVFSSSFKSTSSSIRLLRSFAFRIANRYRPIKRILQELAG